MENEERNYIPAFFEQHNLKAFVKVSLDAAQIDKIHFSFVAHSGKPQCNPIDNIEFYMSPGKCLAFTQFVLSGAAKKLRDREVEVAEKNNQQYARDIWETQGGKSGKWAKDGQKLIWRQLILTPGAKRATGARADFVLKANMAEGESVEMGGVTRKSGAPMTTIMVQFSAAELVSMCRLIEMHWQTVIDAKNRAFLRPNEIQTAQPPQNTAGPAGSKETHVYAIYDTAGTAFRIVLGEDNAVAALKETVKEMLHSDKAYRCDDKEAFERTITAICSTVPVAIAPLELTSKLNAKDKSILCIQHCMAQLPASRTV